MTPRATDHRRRRGSLVAILGIGVLLAACKDDGGPTTTTSSSSASVAAPTSATTGTTAASDPVALIAERYQTFWQVRFEANRDPVNPGDPRFAQYATGAQLENVTKETTQRRNQGLALRRPEPSITKRRVRDVKVSGDSATLRDCATNDGVVYRVSTGEVVDDSVATYNVEATMRLVDGIWKLAEAKVIQQWEGVAGCALSPDFAG